MTSWPTLLSGAVAAPPPLPHRPPRRDGDMPWDEAIDRHRHRLIAERDARRQPWSVATVEAALDEATRQLMELQAAALDLLDEGRLGDDTAVRGLARLLDGIELEAALDPPLAWIAEAAPPRLTTPPRLLETRSLRQRWQRAQSSTRKPVKLSLLGPRSFAGQIDDAVHGSDVDAGAHAIADALNPGLRVLGEAGCPALELVEPALLTATPKVTARGFEAIARTLHRVPPTTERWLRLVPADLNEPWLASPPPTLHLKTFADLLEDLPIDGVILEPASVLSDPDVLDRWRRLRVALIAVPAAADASFQPDEAAAHLAVAAARLDPDRLRAAVDGGGAQARWPLQKRLVALAAAAALVR